MTSNEQPDCPACIGATANAEHQMGTRQHPASRRGLESYAIALDPSLAPDFGAMTQGTEPGFHYAWFSGEDPDGGPPGAFVICGCRNGIHDASGHLTIDTLAQHLADTQRALENRALDYCADIYGACVAIDRAIAAEAALSVKDEDHSANLAVLAGEIADLRDGERALKTEIEGLRADLYETVVGLRTIWKSYIANEGTSGEFIVTKSGADPNGKDWGLVRSLVGKYHSLTTSEEGTS